MNIQSKASIHGSKVKDFLSVNPTSIRPRRSFSLQDTINRYFALQLKAADLRDSDIRHLCDVPKGFLRRIVGEFDLAPSWLLKQATKIVLRGGVNLANIFVPAIQPGATLDWDIAKDAFANRRMTVQQDFEANAPREVTLKSDGKSAIASLDASFALEGRTGILPAFTMPTN